MKRLLLALTLFASACHITTPPVKPPSGPAGPVQLNVSVFGPTAGTVTGTLQPDLFPVVTLQSTGGARYAFNLPAVDTGGATVCYSAPNFVTVCHRLQDTQGDDLAIPPSGAWEIKAETLQPSWPQPVARAPLTFEGNDGSLVCHTDLPAGLIIPQTPNLTFWRGDAWGVTVPGLPFVNGGSSVHPERVLTWFFDRWSPDWQKAILNAYRQRGYTHFALSWPDSRSGNGQSVQQFVATAQTVKAAIPYVAVFLTSKAYDPANADAPTRMAAVTPVLDALMQAHAVDIAVVGWELDLFNDGQDLENFIDALSQRYPTLPLFVHFTTYKTSWQPDGQPRAQFWQHMAAFRASVGATGQIGLLYQGNPTDSCGLQQAHFNDAQVEASGLADNGAVLVPWELVADQQFDGPDNETFGYTRGRELLATPGPLLASGGGNGLFNADGTPTLSSYPTQP